MATVIQTKKFNHEESQRRVRHPLETLRKYIRAYVILEGLALTLLAGAVLFWLGLAFDFGLYKVDFDLLGIHGIDWILELNEVDATGMASLACRLTMIAVVVVCLAYLGFTKVVLRWLRDFNDDALALVLERRFHKELGDRLITAVELADPKLAVKYGYSQAMVEKTILEAINTLDKLPVASVFNWSRLYKLWSLVVVSTVGIWLGTMTVVCSTSYALAGEDGKWTDPYRFCWKFYHTASIWTERNVLMMNIYWPKRSHLEIERFQPSHGDKNDMRVARDDVRPDLQVRAIQWAIADRSALNGWRPLKWKDLAEHKLIDAALLARVNIPVDFPDWLIDTDELEPNLVAALWETDQAAKKSGEIRAHLAKPAMQAKIEQRGAQADLDKWLDWTTWTVDKIAAQLEDTKAREPLRGIEVYPTLETIFKELNVLAESPSMERTLRKLVVPASVEMNFRGEESGRKESIEKRDGNKYPVSLADLKESLKFKFRARGEDFYTPPKTISLVPAPSPSGITIDKEEPAYIYHRLYGPDQMDLKGKKHLTTAFPLSTTGDTNTVEVHFGGKLVIHVAIDRKLRAERAVFTRDPAALADGFVGFRGEVKGEADQKGFSLTLDNVTRKHDFTVEFIDEDNIRGKRRFKVLSTLDTEPQVGNLSIYSVLLRKPRFKQPSASDKDRDPREQAELTGAYLITPIAKLPFECSVKDDYGLVKVGYQYRYRFVDFELIAAGGAKKLPNLQIEVSTHRRRANLAMTNFHQFWPGNPASWFAPYHVWVTSDALYEDLRLSQGFTEGYSPAHQFQKFVDEGRYGDMHRLDDVQKNLNARRSPRIWEFDFKDDIVPEPQPGGFDVRDVVLELRSVDPDKIGQMHFHLQIAVQATDNNVETGAVYFEKGKRLQGNTRKNPNGYVNFLVITENELLAQIALEEGALLEKLEAAKEKVDAGLTSLLEQQSKTRDEKPDIDSIFLRMTEIRTALQTSGNNLRDVQHAYRNIIREMEVNRVRKERMEKIQYQIIDRLDNIVQQSPIDLANTGSFPRAEDAFQKAYDLVERDAGAQRLSDVEGHRLNMTDAHRQMTRLSDEIKKLLDYLDEGKLEAQAIAMLVTVERMQREKRDWFYQRKLDIERKIIEELLKDDKKQPPEEKKEEKKTGQLGSPRPAGALAPSDELRRRAPFANLAHPYSELVWSATPRDRRRDGPPTPSL
ncbi:MAG: hypothetical protein EXR98_02680 [Gemmataceae bacterium]|nr:hypothetical protein [Gemmataceae bacterium]